jgi:hypothetical protein
MAQGGEATRGSALNARRALGVTTHDPTQAASPNFIMPIDRINSPPSLPAPPVAPSGPAPTAAVMSPRGTAEAGQMPARGRASPTAGAEPPEPPSPENPFAASVEKYLHSQAMSLVRNGQQQVDKTKAARDEHTADMEEDEEPL